MNRATARRILRRRLKDVATDFQKWDDASLNELLDEGMIRVQTRVMACVPDSFLAIRIGDLEADRHLYPMPAGAWYETEVAIKDATYGDGTGYRPLDKGDYYRLRMRLDSDPYKYARFGNYLYIQPAPSTTVTDGLKITMVPTISWGDDTATPPLHVGLHMDVLYWAQVFAFGETDESTEDLRKIIDRLEGDIPTYYSKSGGTPEILDIDVYKGY